MASFPNIYAHRKVAETSAKGCDLCYKPSTSVLVTPEKQDFFYVCPSHLKDRWFCSPIIDQAAIDAKKKREMEEEVERVKKEYEERQRKKKEKEESAKSKDKDKGKEDEKEKGKDKEGENKEDDGKNANESKNEKKDETKPEDEEEPRVFALHRTFYQKRLDQKRQAEMAKRNRERLQNPSFFPSVPKGNP
ncbi:hypothetical protein VSDG_03205 [Cytospora chrysosperma]|uniref:VPS4-associated protein 1 n=1 Tax=Cytospora chrysosperma TaxID=252740 RepID=A0A423WBC3_CYTCH|nr:hypothetical protein VSDG_03205 [Valsa sordida]